MIEGLKVTVTGEELKALCRRRASQHMDNAELCDADAKRHRSNNLTIPAAKAEEKAEWHRGNVEEMNFIAEHVYITEEYRLNRADMQILGIVRNQW